MDIQDLIDEIADAMQDVQDMDTNVHDYARAAVKRFGWRDLAKEKPDNMDRVIATDGVHRWMDLYVEKLGPDFLIWEGHKATHWHPILPFDASAVHR